MTSQPTLTRWVTLCLGASAIVGLIIKTFLSIYLWEELTHSGDYNIMGRTSAQVAQSTLGAVLLCGLLSVSLATAQYFATLQSGHSNHISQPKRFAAILAFLCWLFLFLPAAIHAYLFKPGFWHLQ